MKKLTMMIGVGVLALGLAACGNEADQEDPNQETPTEEQAPEGEETDQTPETAIDMESIPEVIATVNGEDIQKENYVALLEQQTFMLQAQGMDLQSEEAANYINMIQDQVLQQLVNERVIIQAATDEGIEATEEEIDAELSTFVNAQFESEEQFNEAIEQEGVTIEEIRNNIAEYIKTEKYVEQNTTTEEISEDELQAAYDELVAMSEGSEESAESDIPTFEEYRGELEAQLQNDQHQQQLAELVESLREESEITIHI